MVGDAMKFFAMFIKWEGKRDDGLAEERKK
jgi:hypothetical protein